MTILESRLTHGIIGFALGDAAGLPVKGQDHAALATAPVTTLQSYGTFNQPAGYYSDETALVLATLDTLTTAFDLDALRQHYADWQHNGTYAPAAEPVIDIWPSVAALFDPEKAAATGQDPGGLIRVLPLAYYLYTQSGEQLFTEAAMTPLRAFVAVTNPDMDNLIASAIYVQTALHLLGGHPLKEAMTTSLEESHAHFAQEPAAATFEALATIDEPAAIIAAKQTTPLALLTTTWWALHTTADYRTAVLAAVNLGGASDTRGALTGGLAGLAYGYMNIPHRWCLTLARYGEIVQMIHRAEDSGHFPNYD